MNSSGNISYLLIFFLALSNATNERGPEIRNKTPMTMRVGYPMATPATSMMIPKTTQTSAINQSNGFSAMVSPFCRWSLVPVEPHYPVDEHK
jgi:hypothetical protein